MSWMWNNPAILNIVNKNCDSPILPSFNHIIVDGESYAIKSGELTEQKGCMPNPMVPCPCIKLDDIKLL